MTDKYILKGKTPIPISNTIAWGEWFENGSNRRVAEDIVEGVRVSTVFLGLDHSFGEGPPLLFETMVFGESPLQEECVRYATWEEAEQGHKAMLEKVIAELKEEE